MKRITLGRYLFYTWLLSWLLWIPTSLLGQDSIWMQNLTLGFQAGFSLNRPVGPLKKEWTNMAVMEDEKLPPSYTLTSSMPLVPGISLSATGMYRINAKISLGGGLQYDQRGYRLKTTQTFHDPNFQYDVYHTFFNKVRMSTWELQLKMYISLNERLGIVFGPLRGWSRSSSATKSLSEKRDVLINGIKDLEWSSSENQAESMIDKIYLPQFLGFFTGFQYHFTDKLWLETQFTYHGSYYLVEGHGLHNISGRIMIGYFLTSK